MHNDRNVPALVPQNGPTTADREKRGLECPKCGCRHFRVLQTRSVTPSRIRRRRECRHCGRRVTTYEHFHM